MASFATLLAEVLEPGLLHSFLNHYQEATQDYSNFLKNIELLHIWTQNAYCEAHYFKSKEDGLSIPIKANKVDKDSIILLAIQSPEPQNNYQISFDLRIPADHYPFELHDLNPKDLNKQIIITFEKKTLFFIRIIYGFLCPIEKIKQNLRAKLRVPITYQSSETILYHVVNGSQHEINFSQLVRTSDIKSIPK